MDRRTFVAAALTLPLLSTAAWATPLRLTVHRSPTCGCCGAWAQHMLDSGFDVTMIEMDQDDLWTLKAQLGVPETAAGCHTAEINGYFVEGHVPASDIMRLVETAPDALGITVPGMPAGSPGMEMGGRVDAFETLLVARDGTTTVFQSHA